jgi:hypothetical protein
MGIDADSRAPSFLWRLYKKLQKCAFVLIRLPSFFLVLKKKSGEAYSAIHVGLLFAVSNGA